MSEKLSYFVNGVLVTVIFILFLNASAPSQYGYLDDMNSPFNKVFTRLDGRNMSLASAWIHPSTVTMTDAVVSNIARAKILDLTPQLSADDVNLLKVLIPDTPVFRTALGIGHIENGSELYAWVVTDPTDEHRVRVVVGGQEYSVLGLGG